MQPATDFFSRALKLNASVANGSTCVVNVTKQPITFVVVIPPMLQLDVGMNEVMNFSVPNGINADLPTVVNGQFTIAAVPEVLLAICNGTSALNPPATAVNSSSNVTAEMRYVNYGLVGSNFLLEMSEEAISNGGITFNFTLLGDLWNPNAPQLVASQVQITNQTANNVPSRLFSSGLISVSGQTLFFTIPPLPDFFVVIDHLVTITIPSEAISSGIVPVVGTFYFYVKAAPPTLFGNNTPFIIAYISCLLSVQPVTLLVTLILEIRGVRNDEENDLESVS